MSALRQYISVAVADQRAEMADERPVFGVQEQSDRNDPEHLELVVLTLLLDPEYPWVWSIEELGRQLGNALDAADAVAHLDAAGLVHRCQDFVFPTRAAIQFSLLVGGL